MRCASLNSPNVQIATKRFAPTALARTAENTRDVKSSRSWKHSPAFARSETKRQTNFRYMVTIALDAMGGDRFPVPEVEGAIRAARDLDVRVILVGREEII